MDSEEEEFLKMEEREEWVDKFNKSLPQIKVIDEFGEFYIGENGIYDSEYMNFVYDNIPSDRIIRIHPDFNLKD